MSQYAKSVVASIAAVLITGIDAWQSVTAGAPFRLLDVLPIAIAIAGAVLTYVIPNVPELPAAKAVVSGVLAALTAVATFVTGHPADVTLLNLIVAGLGALLTWYVPNLVPTFAPVLAAADAAAKATAGQHVDPQEITDALHQLEHLDPAGVAKAVDSSPAPAADAVAAELAAPSVYDQLMAEHTASLAVTPIAAPAMTDVAAVSPDVPADPAPAPIPAPVDPAPATAPMAAVAAGSTPAVPASA